MLQVLQAISPVDVLRVVPAPILLLLSGIHKVHQWDFINTSEAIVKGINERGAGSLPGLKQSRVMTSRGSPQIQVSYARKLVTA